MLLNSLGKICLKNIPFQLRLAVSSLIVSRTELFLDLYTRITSRRIAFLVSSTGKCTDHNEQPKVS